MLTNLLELLSHRREEKKDIRNLMEIDRNEKNTQTNGG